MNPEIKMNKFEIVDLPGMNTIAFAVEKNIEQYKKGNAFLSLQKIEHIDSEYEGKIKKTFNVIETNNESSLIVLLTLTKSKAILSTGSLTAEGFETAESNVPLNYGTIFNQEGIEYKEITYTPNLKRNFCIIDTQTYEEVVPSIHIDNETNTMKGTCKILPQRPYIVLELKFED